MHFYWHNSGLLGEPIGVFCTWVIPVRWKSVRADLKNREYNKSTAQKIRGNAAELNLLKITTI